MPLRISDTIAVEMMDEIYGIWNVGKKKAIRDGLNESSEAIQRLVFVKVFQFWVAKLIHARSVLALMSTEASML